LRATLEATCFGLKGGLDTLTALGLRANAITLTGGGSKSAVWRQALADLFGLPVRILQGQGDEGACFGAALQALWVLQRQEAPQLTLGEVCARHVVVDPVRSARPDPANAAAYALAYAAYGRVLAQLAPLYAAQ